MLPPTPTLIRAALVGLVCFGLARGVEAQCGTPDFMDGGPCCSVTQPNVPVVPDFAQDSLGVCWLDCDAEAIDLCRAQWDQTALPSGFGPCDVFSKRLRLRDASGAVKWRGRFKFQYSRTWLETDLSGQNLQVWRFLINGDMRPTAALGPAPCPRPPCASAFSNRVRFTGYVDYVQRCGTALEEFAWMITHACDQIDHVAGFPRGGSFHPDRSYTFVGPAAGFVVSPVSPPEMGSNSFEGARRMFKIPGSGGLKSCQYEDQVQQTMAPVAQYCFCGPIAGTPQWAEGNLSVFTGCGSAATTPGGPFLPGFLSMGIGMWTDPTIYPGAEVLRWNTGGYDYFESCTGVTRQEVFFGVTTNRGFDAQQVLTSGTPLPLPPMFVDQANSLRGGGAGITTMNRPYWSDHVLNLNY